MEKLLLPPQDAEFLLSDHTDMDRAPLKLTDRHAGGIPISIADDAYFEYVWRDAEGRLFTDPDNPDTNPSVWYGRVSVLTGPGYRPHPVAVEAAERVKPGGTLRRERFHSEALGQLRRVNTYTPAGHEDRPLPTLLVQDGTAFNRLGRLPQMLDVLIERGLQPARLVLLEPVDRSREYSFSTAYRDFILNELLPALPEIAGEPTELQLLGTSLGGLASATLALAAPGSFTGVATLSGAFLGSPGDPDPYRREHEWVLQQVQAGNDLPGRWFVGTGTIEWLHGANERLAAALAARGVDLRYAERSAGHNWPNWRDLIPEALKELLDG